MLNQNHSRVLSRAGARKLTPQQAAVVTGGQIHTNVCTIGSHGQSDGDGHCHEWLGENFWKRQLKAVH